MNRRNFNIGVLSGLMIGFTKNLQAKGPFNNQKNQSEYELTKPNIIKEGDLVGLITPGTAVTDPDELAKAIEIVDYLGLKYKLGKYVKTGTGYKSRTIEERAEDLHSMFKDPEIKAVFCIRGGYGSIQILDYIDYKLISDNPKVFLGYSDITALHLAINKFSGLVTFHGPVMTSSFTEFTMNSLKQTIMNNQPIGKVTNPTVMNNFRKVHPIRTLKSGIAEGRLIGGNLSLISALMGTKYEINTKDSILFLEDVGEEPFRIDRMISQLKIAGKFRDAKGIIFGECAGCNFDKLNSSRVWDYALGEILDQAFSDLNIPIVYGITIGHTSNQITLPIGLKATMNSDEGSITINESAVI